MLTSYKIWYERRSAAGLLESVAVSYHEGEITTETEAAGTPITRYRASRELSTAEVSHADGRTVVSAANGDERIVYGPADFGDISSGADLRAFLGAELAKDATRAPTPDQAAP